MHRSANAKILVPQQGFRKGGMGSWLGGQEALKSKTDKRLRVERQAVVASKVS
jgi:hypothetical protein